MDDEKTVRKLMEEVLERVGEIQADQRVLTTRVDAMSATVDETYRTLRGHNGHVGLVTEMALLREKMTTHSVQQVNDAEEDKKREKKEDENKVTYSWIMEKLIFPVLTPAVVALIIYILFDVIPHVTAQGTP